MKITKASFRADQFRRSNEMSLKIERTAQRINDLKTIRDYIKKGKMTEALYDFINADHSLDHLLAGLPRPNDKVSCEALQGMQLQFIDANIADAEKSLEGFFQKAIELFQKWFENYWDRNRKTYNNLRKMDATFSTSPDAFGTAETFEKMETTTYHGPEWNTMVDAAKALSKIIATIPENNLMEWVEKNKHQIGVHLKEFGLNVDEQNVTIVTGSPVHHRNRNTLRGHRYFFNQISSNCQKAISLLGEERDNRYAAKRVVVLLTKGKEEEGKYINFVKKLVMDTKMVSFIVARSYWMILAQAQRQLGKKPKENPAEKRNTF